MGCVSSSAHAEDSEVEAEAIAEYAVKKGSQFARMIEAQKLAVIKASYFAECLAKKCPFGHRALIPCEAIYPGHEAAGKWYERGFQFLIIISYTWLSRDHPDPHLFHLPILVDVLNKMESRWGMEPGVILDFCSFWQGDRTPKQDQDFKECLKMINVPYGHQSVLALKLTKTPEGEARGYDDRGWTKFESDIIDSKARAPYQEDFEDIGSGHMNVLTSAGETTETFESMTTAARHPPATPERFEAALLERERRASAKGVNLFTNGKDQPFILKKYAEAFAESAGRARMLHYPSMGWGEAEAEVLAEALPYYKNLERLKLEDNCLGEASARALAPAFARMTGLTDLLLKGNDLREAGARALAPALAEMTGLQILDLEGNGLGEPGVQALAPALMRMTGLLLLALSDNGIGEAGTRALVPALEQMTVLQGLGLGTNGLGLAGVRALAPALAHMTGLEQLDLRSNDLQEEDVQELKSFLLTQAASESLTISVEGGAPIRGD